MQQGAAETVGANEGTITNNYINTNINNNTNHDTNTNINNKHQY